MPDLIINSTPAPDPEDVKAVHAGLRAYNEHHAGPGTGESVHLFLRDASGTVRGGLLGRRGWGWLYVDVFWIEESLRGQGWGRTLLRQAEAEAWEAGCTRSFLDTFGFQARPFYEREGYRVFGELEDFPPGYSRYYMRKDLGPAEK